MHKHLLMMRHPFDKIGSGGRDLHNREKNIVAACFFAGLVPAWPNLFKEFGRPLADLHYQLIE